MNLVEALRAGTLIADGANGTALAAKGFRRQPYDLANLTRPELVREVHSEFIAAGSNIIETNTFSAGRIRLAESHPEIDVAELNFAGASLARQAAKDSVFVLGAIGPIGKPMAPIGNVSREEVMASVREQAAALAEGGVDAIILETFMDMEELLASIEAVQQATDLPIIASKAFIEDGEMLAEGYPAQCALRLADTGVAAIGANCIVGPQRMLDLVRMMVEVTDLPVFALPTPGLPQLVKGEVAYETSPEYFARAALRLFEEGAKVVGGCCGVEVAHVQQLRALVDEKPIKVRTTVRARAEKEKEKQLVSAEPSELSQKIGRKFVSAVELDLPRGLNLQKLVNAAKQLKIAGVDTINISDGARARLRMNPTSACAVLRREVGIDTTMHFACRDRNLLAVQADLLGCHALGIRNILAITGDPANIGDYPSATSVFDIDAIGLIRILSRFNEGIDLAGYSVGQKCAFTICGAYNPCAIDQNTEDERLQRKADAGLQVIYTQPVFEFGGVDAAVKAGETLGIPVLVGVMPLRNARHAEFMHNEVPGISVPESLRKRILEASDDAAAAAIGLEECCKLAQYIRTKAAGLYIMPPANQPSVAEKIVEAIQ